MHFERFKTPGLAHISYLIGDDGDAAVIDPGRDFQKITRRAAELGLRLRYVLETHRHEDFIIGAGALAKATGAQIVVGRNPLFGHGDLLLADGEEVKIGAIRLRLLETPGHTPESVCYAVYLSDTAPCWGAFTGDTLFIGETGRTDLPDPKKTGEAAGQLYDAVHTKLLPLGDQTLVLPAHGSGSVCGANIADRDDSTLGYERHGNPVFTKSRDEFIHAKIDERIPRPPYFSRMEKINAKGGTALARNLDEIRSLSPEAFRSESAQGIVIDLREPDAFAAGHVPGSYNIWAQGLGVFAGWIVPPGTKVFLVPEQPDSIESLETAQLALARIGIDECEAILAKGFPAWRQAGLPVTAMKLATPAKVQQAVESGEQALLDVRDDVEFERDGHAPQAHHLYVGYIEDELDRLRGPSVAKSKPVAVTCEVGHRAGLAASMLLRKGYSDVTNMLGGMTAWSKLGYPTDEGTSPRSVTTPQVEGERR